ncbi:tyrosyl-DNA phosphodiesterase-domain-containing protein [Mycena polygramma]|nr:tyrosyl-DNA phosphodiesterase-domain-containing protein [Mycena polygramma]
MNTTTGGAVAKGSKSLSKAEPIVVDDSETEDDSEHERMISLLSGKTGTAEHSARPARVVKSHRKGHASEPISVLDSDDSDVEEANGKKNALTSVGRGFTAVASTSSRGASFGKRKEEQAAPSSQNAPLGLPDRAQMEAERLARGKRILEEDQITANPKRHRALVLRTAKTPLASRIFYDGAFFPTATLRGNPRADGREAIGFEDVIGPASSDLKLAIISSYCLDEEWLAPYFHPSVPVIAVFSAKDGPSIKSSNWIQACPKVGTGGCFHMKYMVLLYKSGRLRVVVSTANLVAVDWLHLENCVFIQDVFLHSASNVIGSGSLSAERRNELDKGSTSEARGFAMILESVLKATNVGPALQAVKQKNPEVPLKSITDLSKLWNWSSVTAELVPSIAGKWEGWTKIKTTGHPRLMCAIERLGLAVKENEDLIVECQGSSIGPYTTQWFNQFYISAKGHPSALKRHIDDPEGDRKQLSYPPGVKVVFPTLATVKSTGIQLGAHSLFCTRKKWKVPSFPRKAFYDSKSSAGPVLLHTKMIIGSFTQKNAAAKLLGAAGWMYVGSHNFTSAAWGNLSGSGHAPLLNVNNYELGVVVPLMTLEDLNTASAWERPPKKYTAEDVPWFQDENPPPKSP